MLLRSQPILLEPLQQNAVFARPRPLAPFHHRALAYWTQWQVITVRVIIRGVIRSFADAATEDLFNGVDSRRARKGCPSTLWDLVARILTQLNRVRELRELAIPPGNRLEALKGTRRRQHSIRINDQFRICFRWEESYADDVEVTDYH